MDEPTNYLDVSHIDWLVNYLNDFPGAFIVVSHDYDFLGRITNCIIDIDFGTITRYTGTLKQAMRQKEANRQTYVKAYANQQKVQRVAIVTASIALGVWLSTMFQEAMVKHLRRIHVREKKE